MATSKSRARSNGRPPPSGRQEEARQKRPHDIVGHVTDYVRHKPGYVVLCCIGVGFVLG